MLKYVYVYNFFFLNLRRDKTCCRGGREKGLLRNQRKTKLSQTQRFLLLITKFMDDEYMLIVFIF